MNIIDLNPMRTELLNIQTYLKYLLDTVNKLLAETPDEHMYQAAWLSKCLNLEEILIIFQNQFINKREKFNLVLVKTLKELNSDIDTKMQTVDNKTQANLPELSDIENPTPKIATMSDIYAISNQLLTLKEDLAKRFEIMDPTMLNHIKLVKDKFTTIEEDLQKRFETVDTSIVSLCTEIHAINTRLQELANKEQLLSEQKQKEDTNTPLKTPKGWSIHVDEVKQKMKEKGWNEHEVCELAKINFNSFRKFQKKDPKLSNVVVNKILQLFNINSEGGKNE